MWGSATRRKERKERKERRKGSRIFLLSKKVFFGKVGLGARMKGRKTRSLKKEEKRHEKQKRRYRKEGGVFQRGLSTHIEKTWGKIFILERGIGKEKQALLL